MGRAFDRRTLTKPDISIAGWNWNFKSSIQRRSVAA